LAELGGVSSRPPGVARGGEHRSDPAAELVGGLVDNAAVRFGRGVDEGAAVEIRLSDEFGLRVEDGQEPLTRVVVFC